MLVSGGAVSEKRGTPAKRDAAMSSELTDAWTTPTPDGEKIANRVGWADTLRRWVDVARRPLVDSQATSALHPGDPTNQELSQGMAFLLDLPVP